MQAENCNSARLRLVLLQFLPALLVQLIPNTTAPHPITYTYIDSMHSQNKRAVIMKCTPP